MLALLDWANIQFSFGSIKTLDLILIAMEHTRTHTLNNMFNRLCLRSLIGQIFSFGSIKNTHTHIVNRPRGLLTPLIICLTGYACAP
jgi:hypothetical protein